MQTAVIPQIDTTNSHSSMNELRESRLRTVRTVIFLLIAIGLLIFFHLRVNHPSELSDKADVLRLDAARFNYAAAPDKTPTTIDWDASEVVSLPHVWAEAGILRTGTGWYRMTFRIERTPLPDHILIPRVGVNGRVYVNGVLFKQVGETTPERTYRPWNRPHLITLPDGIIKPGENELVFELFAERAGFSGLSSLYMGPATPLFYFHAQRLFMQNTFASISVGLTLFAAVILLLIFSQFRRETYWLLLSAFFFLLSVRIANFSFFDVPKNSDAFEKAVYSLHFLIVGLSHWMTLVKADVKSRRWKVAIAVYTLLNTGVIWLIKPQLALEAAAVLTLLTLPFSLLFIVWMLRQVVQSDNRYALMHIVLILTYFAFALNDWAVISFASRFEESLVSHYLGALAVATISLYLIQQFINVYQSDRKTRKQLVATLEKRDIRIAEQVQSLVALEKRRLSERQGRLLMSEMHDGIGSVLNNLKLMLLQENPDKKTMATVIQRSLDDLRMTLVAVDPDERSLGAMLAQIRADYSRNLVNAGIQVVWQIDEKIEEIDLDPSPRLHIARIVQEAITNSLKHSGCKLISVSVLFADSKLHITIADDGCGISEQQQTTKPGRGIGLRSMRTRANEAGFTLTIQQREGGKGTAVYLEAPV